MSDVRNLTAGGPAATGGVLRAPVGSVLPVDASTPFAAPWKNLGLVGEDGLAPAGERNLESIRDWNGDTVADLQTDHSSSFTFPLMEVFNEDVLKSVFGDGNVTVTPATPERGKLYTIIEDGEQLPFMGYGFDMRYVGKKMRILVPNGKITTVEETPFIVGGLNMFTCTVSAYKDESGKKVYRYYEDELRAA